MGRGSNGGQSYAVNECHVMKASATLEATILANAPAHYATPDAPNSYRELMAWWEEEGINGAPMPVYDGGCDQTIYSRPEVNFAFRAWHDMLHIKHGLTFKPKDEMLVCLYHQAALTNDNDKRMIYVDIVGQVLYYQRYGKFVQDQQGFMDSFINNGYQLEG